jgi:tetratricopeptide (TPR) repeat protein
VERSGEIWRQGLQHYPNSALLRCKLSFLETWFRRNEAASKLVDEAKAQKRKSQLDEWCIHYAQATISMYGGQRRQAASEARKVLDMSPYDTMAYADMAWVLRNSGSYHEAVDAMTFAITHDPAPREWYFFDLVRMHQAAGQMKELVLLAEAEVQNNSRYAKWWYDVLGSAYKNLGERDKAEAAWRKASTLPDPPEL